MNKVIHGDCLEIMPTLSDKSIDMILTDIPYGNVSQCGAERAKYSGQLRKINKGAADIETFELRPFIEQLDRLCCGSIYIFCGIPQINEIYDYFKNERSVDYMSRVCVWEKTNPTPANGQHMWLSGTEFAIFAKRRKAVYNENCKSNVWKNPSGKSKVHPTEKPIELFKRLVLASSNEGDVVLDPCAGSGTTAIACLNTNRNYILIEKEKEYIDKTNKRIAEHEQQQTLFAEKNL